MKGKSTTMQHTTTRDVERFKTKQNMLQEFAYASPTLPYTYMRTQSQLTWQQVDTKLMPNPYVTCAIECSCSHACYSCDSCLY